MEREGNTKGVAGQPVLYEQSDASRLSELDPEVVSYCVEHALVKPVLRDGKSWFTGSDILKLKLLRIGRDLMDERSGSPSESADELAGVVRQLLNKFQK
jgi:hypothetical protein